MKKTINVQTIQLFIGLACLLLVIGFFGDRAHASVKKFNSIHCQTAFGEKVFSLQENTVAFFNNQSGRSLSSINNAISQSTFSGLKRTLYIDGNKHFINLKDINNFDDSEDFLTITSSKGHKITYPLNCKFEN